MRTTVLTKDDLFELESLKIFNNVAAELLKQAVDAGKKVEKVESSFNDVGNDYVEFKVDGKTVCHIDGY